MDKLRYICFNFTFLYSLAVFFQLAQKRARRGTDIDEAYKLNNQTSKVQSDYYTEPPPPHHPSSQMGPPKYPEMPSPFRPHQWHEVFRKKPSVLRNLQCSVLSLHPVLIPSVWVTKDGLAWALNWKDATSLPSHTPDPSLSSLAIITTHIHTHIFWQLADTLINNIWVLWPLQRGPSLLFDPWINEYSVRAFPVVTADYSRSPAAGGHRGVPGESSGELEDSSGISSSAIGWFSLFFSFGGWW